MAGSSPIVRVFFQDAELFALSAALDEVADSFRLTEMDQPQWFFPGSGDWRVCVRSESNMFEGYSERWTELIREYFGPAPSQCLTLTLHWRCVNEACDAATILVLHLLSKFYGVVNEGCGFGMLWTLEDIRERKSGVRFLDCYRE